MFANNVTDYDAQWARFKEKYSDPVFEPLIAYIQDEWLNDCPEHFLRVHTRGYLHLNQTATSRLKGLIGCSSKTSKSLQMTS
jgi:hypothetical protein